MEQLITYQYLNLADRWPSFSLTGMVNEGGQLQLAPLPGQPAIVGPPLGAAELAGPAGVASDAAGNLYIADPAGHRIWRVDSCDGQAAPLLCLRGPGSEAGEVDTPRGVAIDSLGRLIIADSGNHRLQVVHLESGRIVAIWGQPEGIETPLPGVEPGEFNAPWDIAVDAAGAIYVADHGNNRVQKMSPHGRVQPAFWQTVATEPETPGEPVAVVIISHEDEERLLVVDAAPERLLIYGLDGVLDAALTATWADIPAFTGPPAGALLAEDRLYVSAAGSGRLYVFASDGTFQGVVESGLDAIAGLALDKQGRLLLQPAGGPTVQLKPAARYGRCGSFLAGPFTSVRGRDTPWGRIAVTGAIPAGAHLSLFTLSSNSFDGAAGGAPMPPGDCLRPPTLPLPTQLSLTPVDSWRPARPDSLDLLALNEPGAYFWLAGVAQGDGTVTPSLEQIRLGHDEPSWLDHLPEIHAQDETNRVYLEKALALMASHLDDLAAEIDGLPMLFDPAAAPLAGVPESWLDWLASWLAFPLDETWAEPRKRAAIAGAFALYGQRGTAESLETLISLYTGAPAFVEQPAGDAALWLLGDGLALGLDTMLAPAEAQGAVLGTTATLDQAHLIATEEFGAPLFAEMAHHFCVQVYAANAATPAALRAVEQIIDREKPAHTTYHLCQIGPSLRVGFQGRLGIDTIVAGSAAQLSLDSGGELGVDSGLPDDGTALLRLGRNTEIS